MKKIIWSLLLGLSLSGQVWADEYVNVVKNVTVNTLNPMKTVSYVQVVNALGQPKTTNVSTPDGCLPTIVVRANYAGKKGYIEYFEQDNPAALFGKPFEYQNTRLKGKLAFRWTAIASLDEKVMLDDWQVSPTLSFDQFKQRFPLSTKNPFEVGKNGEVKYAVVFGLNAKKSPNQIGLDEVYLSRYVLFTFKNKKLSQLSIEQGNDC